MRKISMEIQKRTYHTKKRRMFVSCRNKKKKKKKVKKPAEPNPEERKKEDAGKIAREWVRNLFFVGSNLLNRYALWWGTYWQHVKAPGQSVYEASNTTTHRGLNTLIFNNGYHTAHHEKPGLHWSLLPERTCEIQHLIPDRCLRNDINFHL